MTDLRRFGYPYPRALFEDPFAAELNEFSERLNSAFALVKDLERRQFIHPEIAAEAKNIVEGMIMDIGIITDATYG